MVSSVHGSQRSHPSLEKDDTDAAYIENVPNNADPNHKFNDAKLKPRLTPAERKALLDEALEVDPGVKPWSWRAIQTLLVVLVTCCCSGDSGFDGTVMGGINSMAQYQHYFGLEKAAATTGIIFGIFTVGSLVASIPSSYIPDKFGRRTSMFFGNSLLIIGAVITATSTTKRTFIGGRFLTGVGSGVAGASAKSYLAEITAPQVRGRYMGILNSFYYVGQMTATGMMVSTGSYAGSRINLSWRLPLYVQCVPAAINVAFIFLCPESPRWLYAQGKPERARQILANFHSRTADSNSPLVNLEMSEIEERISLDGSDKRWWDFRTLFTTRADRYRAGMCILIGAFGQLSGNGLITYFLPVLLEQAGIKSQHKRLVLNFINSITSMIGAVTGALIVDRLGRRKLLLWGTSAVVICLAIVVGLLHGASGDKTVDPGWSVARGNAGIAFIYLFMVIFSFGWTSMQALYPAEVLSYESRAKGLAFLGIVVQASSCINTFALPVALQNIGWKVYVIFLVWDVFEVIMIYFFIVETKGLTLEEIDDVFQQENPRKYSTSKHFLTSPNHKGGTA